MNILALSLLADTVSNSDSGASSSTITTAASNASNDVVAIAGAIDEYGILVVMAGAFIAITILIMIFFLKMNSSMMKTITKQMDRNNENSNNVASKLVNYVTKDTNMGKPDKEKDAHKSKDDSVTENSEDTKKHHSKDLVKLSIDRETIFRSASKIVFDKEKCSRVGIYVFHNGNETPYGLPFIKMSCIFDQGITGTKTQRALTHTNLPLHYFNDMVESLYTTDEYFYNVDASDKDNSVHSFTAGSNTKAGYCSAIRSDDGVVLGFISCEFNHNIDFGNNEITNEIRQAVHEMSISIKYIIINKSKQSE